MREVSKIVHGCKINGTDFDIFENVVSITITPFMWQLKVAALSGRSIVKTVIQRSERSLKSEANKSGFFP